MAKRRKEKRKERKVEPKQQKAVVQCGVSEIKIDIDRYR
jgi:hypothetical protein